MPKSLKCPVCGKPLTQDEFDRALGLWERKQEHIEHLQQEQRKLKQQQKRNELLLQAERLRLRKQQAAFGKERQKLEREAKKRLQQLALEGKAALEKQRTQIQQAFERKVEAQVKAGVERGVAKQRAEIKKQAAELGKTKNKMAQLERSLQLSAEKYEKASEEIRKLKSQIERGITPQIEGLLEESKLLARLRQLFPQDEFAHPGKKGDIIQHVIAQGKEVGRILYECKKVKNYDKKHVAQAKAARSAREADFAVLVTNAFPSKKQYYFVEKDVFVISPVSLEPVTITLRESLVRIGLLRLTTQAKQKAVQQIYDFLSSSEYANRVNDMSDQLLDLAAQLKGEMRSHRGLWEKRYSAYQRLFSDVNTIDHRLRLLLQGGTGIPQRALPAPRKGYPEIEELAAAT